VSYALIISFFLLVAINPYLNLIFNDYIKYSNVNFESKSKFGKVKQSEIQFLWSIVKSISVFYDIEILIL
jgi:hypothetical protein